MEMFPLKKFQRLLKICLRSTENTLQFLELGRICRLGRFCSPLPRRERIQCSGWSASTCLQGTTYNRRPRRAWKPRSQSPHCTFPHRTVHSRRVRHALCCRLSHLRGKYPQDRPCTQWPSLMTYTCPLRRCCRPTIQSKAHTFRRDNSNNTILNCGRRLAQRCPINTFLKRTQCRKRSPLKPRTCPIRRWCSPPPSREMKQSPRCPIRTSLLHNLCRK